MGNKASEPHSEDFISEGESFHGGDSDEFLRFEVFPTARDGSFSGSVAVSAHPTVTV